MGAADMTAAAGRFVVEDLPFLAAAGMAVGGALLAVTLRSVFRAALGLMLSLFGIAGLFLIQHAEFMAVVQMLVYVGGVSVLIVFAIMLTEREGSTQNVSLQRGLLLPAVVIAVALAGVAAFAVLRAPFIDPPASTVGARDLGLAFLGPFLVPFEAVSVLLLVAVIGALLIAREHD